MARGLNPGARARLGHLESKVPILGKLLRQTPCCGFSDLYRISFFCFLSLFLVVPSYASTSSRLLSNPAQQLLREHLVSQQLFENRNTYRGFVWNCSESWEHFYTATIHSIYAISIRQHGRRRRFRRNGSRRRAKERPTHSCRSARARTAESVAQAECGGVQSV